MQTLGQASTKPLAAAESGQSPSNDLRVDTGHQNANPAPLSHDLRDLFRGLFQNRVDLVPVRRSLLPELKVP